MNSNRIAFRMGRSLFLLNVSMPLHHCHSDDRRNLKIQKRFFNSATLRMTERMNGHYCHSDEKGNLRTIEILRLRFATLRMTEDIDDASVIPTIGGISNLLRNSPV